MILHAEAFGNSALFYEILDHPYDVFRINPSTGHIINQWPLDFEHVNFYNFSLSVTNTLGTYLLWEIQSCFSKNIFLEKFPAQSQNRIERKNINIQK